MFKIKQRLTSKWNKYKSTTFTSKSEARKQHSHTSYQVLHQLIEQDLLVLAQRFQQSTFKVESEIINDDSNMSPSWKHIHVSVQVKVKSRNTSELKTSKFTLKFKLNPAVFKNCTSRISLSYFTEVKPKAKDAIPIQATIITTQVLIKVSSLKKAVWDLITGQKLFTMCPSDRLH